MPRKNELTLSSFDNRLLDGLSFCRSVYDFFDQVRRRPGGIRKLRLRTRKDETGVVVEKKLIEELIPLARYIQARYREGRRIKIRWASGSQAQDAVLLLSGAYVESLDQPRRLFVEVTTSVHIDDHLLRKYFDDHNMSFGVKGIARNDQTGEIVSEPYVFTNEELIEDLTQQILKALTKKAAKRYPQETVLVINCIANSLLCPNEWQESVDRVTKAKAHLAFKEVFLIEPVSGYSATLYGHTRQHDDQP